MSGGSELAPACMAGADWTAAILQSSRGHRLLLSPGARSVKGAEGGVMWKGNEGGQRSGVNQKSALEEWLCGAVRIGQCSSAEEREEKGREIWCDLDSPAWLPE